MTVTALLVAAHGVGVAVDRLPHPIGDLNTDDRFALALAVAGIAGVIVGFTAAAIATYVSLASGARMRYLRDQVGESLDKTWSAVIRGPILLTAVLLVAAVTAASDVSTWLIEVAAVLLVARLARLGWLIAKIVEFGVKDASESDEYAIN